MLGIGLFATLCANVFINGTAFLIPTLRAEFGLDLARAGLIWAMPAFGMVLTLVGWGYLVDRLGERLVLAVGSALTAAAATLTLAPADAKDWGWSVAAMIVAPVVTVSDNGLATLIGAAGFPVAFAVCAVFPMLAIPLVPVPRE